MTGNTGTDRLSISLAFWLLVFILMGVSSYFTWVVQEDLNGPKPAQVEPAP